jgi:hypothetical protein
MLVAKLHFRPSFDKLTRQIEQLELQLGRNQRALREHIWKRVLRSLTSDEPPVRVFQKQEFHAFVIERAHLGVVGRIEIQKRTCFGLRLHVEGVSVDGLNACLVGETSPLCIEFNSVARHGRMLCELRQGSSGSDAGVDRGCTFRPKSEQFRRRAPSIGGNG